MFKCLIYILYFTYVKCCVTIRTIFSSSKLVWIDKWSVFLFCPTYRANTSPLNLYLSFCLATNSVLTSTDSWRKIPHFDISDFSSIAAFCVASTIWKKEKCISPYLFKNHRCFLKEDYSMQRSFNNSLWLYMLLIYMCQM